MTVTTIGNLKAERVAALARAEQEAAGAAAMREAAEALLRDYRDLHDNDVKRELFEAPMERALSGDVGRARLAERDELRAHVRNLLARIFRDGGERAASFESIDKAVEEADREAAEMIAHASEMVSNLVDDLRDARAQLATVDQARADAIAGRTKAEMDLATERAGRERAEARAGLLHDVLAQAHSCATVDTDTGICGGCFVSEALDADERAALAPGGKETK